MVISGFVKVGNWPESRGYCNQDTRHPSTIRVGTFISTLQANYKREECFVRITSAEYMSYTWFVSHIISPGIPGAGARHNSTGESSFGHPAIKEKRKQLSILLYATVGPEI